MVVRTWMNNSRNMVISHKHLLALNGTKGFGPKKIHAIASYLLEEGNGQLNDVEMCELIADLIGRKAIKGVKQFEPSEFKSALIRAERILDQSAAIGISMISRYETSYPKTLLDTVSEDGKESIPLFFFYKGDLSIIGRKSIAIIGTREPSSEGETAGNYFAKVLAQKGFNIVSGLALGCDTAAHKGAIDGNGVTTATLGGGIDKVYPSENTELADCIVRAGGLLLSEYPVGEETTPYTLVARDRLQPALSQAVIVIQTDINGGTVHAVNAAAAVGKPVYAVEYRNNLEFKYDGGNKYLIQKHIARPITSSVDDISSLITSLNSVDTLPVLNEQLSLF